MYNHTKTDSQSEQGFRYQGHGCGNSFKSRLAEHFGRKGRFDKIFSGPFANRKAANIQENNSSFIISLYAAGLHKSNFKISASDDVLTISYTAPQNPENESHFSYKEYEPGSFERSFQLNGKVLTDNIGATYVDGVLIVTLPKNPATNVPAQEVPVS